MFYVFSFLSLQNIYFTLVVVIIDLLPINILEVTIMTIAYN